jgi:hypothetical protein
MKSKPIYVELDIHASLDELWEHTQAPELHEQWDLRFTEIRYLPRANEADKQRFLYQTRIGFGLNIAGTGETSSKLHHSANERLSTLTFGSEQPVSLICHGGGYWKYKQHGEGVTFITLYDYKTRFGMAGRLLDRYIFRPLFGYATAWSFDRLRIWLEDRIPPAVVAERALIHYASVIIIMLLWCYEGIVPKLLYPEAGELSIMKQLGFFEGIELQMVQLLGVIEVGFGLLAAYWHRKKWTSNVQIGVLLLLALPALVLNPELLREPFNPLTLTLPMVGLCLAAHWSRSHLPKASRCKRRPEHVNTKRGGIYNEFDL